ncbi:MAG: cytochrome c biogenesis protein CcdA [Anaerolineales bacterium]
MTLSQPTLSRRLLLFLHSLAFVAGFSLIFIVGWGGAATAAGQFFAVYKNILAKIGGIIVIIFGLYTLGWLHLPFLAYDTRPDFSRHGRGGLLGSGLMGIFFAAGWTPCIGATLGAILTLGFSQETSGQAMWLASGYALGLGVPFLLLGLGMERAAAFVQRFRRHLRTVQTISGLLMLAIGVLILSNQLTLIAVWAQRNGLFLDLPINGALTPSYGLAVLAGMLSFLSPCVLPLVPAYLGYLSGHAFGTPAALPAEA